MLILLSNIQCYDEVDKRRLWHKGRSLDNLLEQLDSVKHDHQNSIDLEALKRPSWVVGRDLYEDTDSSFEKHKQQNDLVKRIIEFKKDIGRYNLDWNEQADLSNLLASDYKKRHSKLNRNFH